MYHFGISVNPPCIIPSASDIASVCIRKFKSLKKTGKPQHSEWTVLAGVVMHNVHDNSFQVVALGCGTKCLGTGKLSSKGLVLNDSHGEVLARRALILYFYRQLTIAATSDSPSIFKWNSKLGKFCLNSGCTFHFLSTQTPCGDACIQTTENNREDILKFPYTGCKVKETDKTLIYTGAKLLGDERFDTMEQLIGVVRTKPGRGERTLSMSCSDKIAKWQIMGVQGALIDYLIDQPIYFHTLNFYNRYENDKVAHNVLERAIWKRFQPSTFYHERYKLHQPIIQICHGIETFQYEQTPSRQPSPNGLAWCDVPNEINSFQVSVNGKRQGYSNKKCLTSAAALKISRFHLYKCFLEIIQMKPTLMFPCVDCDRLQFLPYVKAKELNVVYHHAWWNAKTKYFLDWSQKPRHLSIFSIHDVNQRT